MENNNRTVVGTFESRDDAVREIQRLQQLGYTQAEINVYSNPERARTVENLMGVNVEDVEVTAEDEDVSWWETIKNSFNFYVYDADQGDQRIRAVDKADRSDLSPEIRDQFSGAADLLDSYAEELASGKLVIVVDNYREDNSL